MICSTEGSLWTMSLDEDRCRDRFALNLPWTMHTQCGFTVDDAQSTHEKKAYTNKFTISYTDHLGKMHMC